MYSIYLETVQQQRRKQVLLETKKKPRMDEDDDRKEILNKSDDAGYESSDRRPTLRRSTTPFPGSSSSSSWSCHDPHQEPRSFLLTKRNSSCTADTTWLSDEDEDDTEDENEFDWDVLLKNDTHGNQNGDENLSFSDDASDEEGVSYSFSDSDDSSLTLSFRDDNSEEEDTSSLPTTTTPTIQVPPSGLHLPFLRRQESTDTVLTSTPCTCCDQVLYCSQSVTHVLCPNCQVVSLVYGLERHRPSVGVGWNEEEFSNHLDQQWASSSVSLSSLPMPPLI
jgi:hypothetical protein